MRNLMEDYNNQLIAQGDKQGFERGQKQGYENGQKTIAHRMLKKFSDMPEMIAEMTGLSVAEVVALQNTEANTPA